jgi:thiol:disulfide interchange protein DsbD
VTYQGCADAGFCYPPETKIVPLGNALARSSSDAAVGQPSSTRLCRWKRARRCR